jgi:hypothetical protein
VSTPIINLMRDASYAGFLHWSAIVNKVQQIVCFSLTTQIWYTLLQKMLQEKTSTKKCKLSPMPEKAVSRLQEEL